MVKVIQTVQFSFVYDGPSPTIPTSIIASVTIGTDDGSGMMRQYGQRYPLSSGSQTALAQVVNEVVAAIKTAEGIQ